METGLFLLLMLVAVWLFMRLGSTRQSGEFRSSDIRKAISSNPRIEKGKKKTNTKV